MNRRKLSATTKFANEPCRGAKMQRTRKVCRSQRIGFSVSLPSQTRTRTKFIVPEAHFHAKSIGASSVVIACKTAKLFKILYSPTQRDRTIVFRGRCLRDVVSPYTCSFRT